MVPVATLNTPRKTFSTLTYRTRLRFLTKFEEFVQTVAHNEVEEFFSYLMQNTSIGKNFMVPAATKLLVSPILTGVSHLYSKTPDNQKASILSLVAPFFPQQVLKAHGLDVLPGRIQRAKKISRDKKATLMGYSRVMPPSKRKFTEERQQEIILFVLKNSQMSSYPKKILSHLSLK